MTDVVGIEINEIDNARDALLTDILEVQGADGASARVTIDSTLALGPRPQIFELHQDTEYSTAEWKSGDYVVYRGDPIGDGTTEIHFVDAGADFFTVWNHYDNDGVIVDDLTTGSIKDITGAVFTFVPANTAYQFLRIGADTSGEFAGWDPNDYVAFQVSGGGGGTSNWVGARNLDAPNNIIPAHSWTPFGVETNIDAVLRPKGTGSLVAQIPDGTVAGGDKRGINSIDFQFSRADSAFVASGNRSAILCGIDNGVSGHTSAVLCGDGNIVIANRSSVLAGHDLVNATDDTAMTVNLMATENIAIGSGVFTDPAVGFHMKLLQAFGVYETTDTTAALGPYGAYQQFRNTSGVIGIIGCHTINYSNPGNSIFQSSQYTIESYGASGIIIDAWSTGDIIVATCNNTGTQFERMRIDSPGNVTVGAAALTTGATNGFLYIPSCPGIPTGVPTTKTGRVPIIADSAGAKIYGYMNGAWTAPSAGGGTGILSAATAPFGPSNTIFMFNAEGTNGSTTFVDEAGHTITRVGTSTIATAQFQNGVSSFNAAATTDAITLNHIDFAIGNSDFTLEAWFRPTSYGGGGIQRVFALGAAAASTGLLGFEFNYSGDVRYFHFNIINDGGTVFSSGGTVGPALTYNTWNHVAITRTGTTFIFWVGGVNVGSVNPGATTFNSVGVTNTFLCGPAYYDAVRLVRGTALYTGTFTPTIPALPGVGTAGDFWYDTNSHYLYGPRGATSYPIPNQLLASQWAYQNPTTGFVGVGTSAPTNRLHVAGNNTTEWIRIQCNAAGNAGAFDMYSSGTGGFQPGTVGFNTGVAATNYVFSLAGVEAMRIAAAGKVSITCPSPTLPYAGFAALSGNASSYTSIAVGRTSPEFFMGVAAGGSDYTSGSASGDGVLVIQSSRKLQIGFGGVGGPSSASWSGAGLKIGEITPPLTLLELYKSGITAITGTNMGTMVLSGPAAESNYATLDFTTRAGGSGNGVVARVASRVTPTGSQLHFAISNLYTSGVTHVPLIIDQFSNVSIGNNGALATNVTDGFLYVPSCPGTPTGVPTTKTGLVPLIADSSGQKIWGYIGGAWIAPTGGGGFTSPLTTKGDLLTRDASIHVRLPVGTNGQVLMADSTQTGGIKWGAGGGAGLWFGLTAPSDPVAYPFWWKTDDGNLYVYYNDGSSSQWVIAVAVSSSSSSLDRGVLLDAFNLPVLL